VTNRCLRPNLVVDDPSTSFIFKGADMNIAALTSELGFLVNVVNHVQTAEMGNQSLNSLALISARYSHTAIEVLSQVVAVHLITVCQALDIRALHVQFLEAYHPTFLNLVNKHYGKHPLNESSSQVDTVLAQPRLSSSLSTQSPFPLVQATSESLCVGNLAELLWMQLLKSFETTTSMDAQERFPTIAQSQQLVYLDYPRQTLADKLLAAMENFTKAFHLSLADIWRVQKDAYTAHGVATPLLGKGSGAIYTFLRRTLKMPFMTTRL
jgi:phenylalanine ammonia-lyase